MADMCKVTYKIAGDGQQVKSIYKVLQYMERRKTAVVRMHTHRTLHCIRLNLQYLELKFHPNFF